MTSLGDDARGRLTIADLEKAKERSLEQHLRLRAPQTWVVLCASVDQYSRSECGFEYCSTYANGDRCRRVNVCMLRQEWT